MSEVLCALEALIDNGLPVASVKEIIDELSGANGLEDSDDAKILALCSVLDGELNIEQCAYDDCSFVAGRAEYLVLTESEKEERWDACLDSYLDDGGCVPGADSPYFDREKWKNDARMDGAGHALSSYDGSEEEVSAFGEDFYIYRTN
jgi:hypothetical protein